MENNTFEKKTPEKSSYHDTTIVFSAFNSEKEQSQKHSFFNLFKVLKMSLLLMVFVTIALLVYSYAQLSGEKVTGSILGRNYSEIIAIPIINILNTIYITYIIKSSSKSSYTLGKKNITLSIYVLNITLSIITSFLMLFMDASSNKRWAMLFLGVALAEVIRIMIIYTVVLIKNYTSKNLFPIEVAKTKRMGITLITIIPFILLYLYTWEKREMHNENLATIMLALTIVFSVISMFVIVVCSIWASKLENKANSLIEEEEKQSTTIISYIMAIIVAPIVGIAAANLTGNVAFSYWVLGAIIVSLAMIASYLFYVITDYKKNKEERRTPMMNSIILSAHLFMNIITLAIMHILTAKELQRWNYSFLIIFGIFMVIVLMINILFNIETFKYLFKIKLFIIYASFILIMSSVIVISSMIYSDIILTLYNGEITTILFTYLTLSMSLILLTNLILMLKWTKNNNEYNNAENRELIEKREYEKQ